MGKCYICGTVDSYVSRQIDYEIKIDNDRILVPIHVEECEICHEQTIDPATSEYLSTLAKEARQGNLHHFIPVGKIYRAKAS